MKLIILFLISMPFIIGCSSGKSTASVADNYGFSEKNPIKVGGVNSGPINERNYLSRLTGPKGEFVTYRRQGSCCMFESSNASFGGMLDIYEVEIEGDTIKKHLYLNMYDKAKLYAPKGFVLK